jgi:nitrogen fixation NifU-like protein
MSDFYRDDILDHYRNPRNYGLLDKADISVEDANQLCGDHLTLQLKCDDDGAVTGVAFLAQGCALSIASASLLSESIKGKKMSDIEKLDYIDIQELLGVKIGIGRIKCALLPLAAVHMAIRRLKFGI